MNQSTFPELQALRIEMSDEVRDSQFEAITAALREIPVFERQPLRRGRARLRRWAVAMAAVGTALVPVGAVASESAVPGDLLYPIKLTVERIQVIFDSNIDAEHRVSELEDLVDRQAEVDVIQEHIADTRRVLDDTVDRSDLVDRYDQVVLEFDRELRDRPGHEPDQPRDRSEVAPTDDRPATDQPRGDVTDRQEPTVTPTEPTEPHRDSVDHPPKDTTTSTSPEVHDSTTTTVDEREGDGRDGDTPPDAAP